MGAGGGSERGEKMPHVHVEAQALPGWACSRASGRGSSKGEGAPAPWTTRETAEAAEAEAGEARVHALSSQLTRGEGTRKHACLPRGGKGVR